MAINVICRGCHTRFTVGDQHAGKTGPCPKCKAPIEIPKVTEQVVIHEPEHSELGARGTSGELVLKPIERQDRKINTTVVAAAVTGSLMVLVVALILRSVEDKSMLLALGAIALAPPLAWAGYEMLRDDEELEPFTGVSLWTRVAICSVCYALLWALFAFVYRRFIGEAQVEIWQALILGVVFLPLGGGVAFCCFDFDLGNGVLHYCLYLLVTIALRMVAGLPPIGPPVTETNAAAAAIWWMQQSWHWLV